MSAPNKHVLAGPMFLPRNAVAPRVAGVTISQRERKQIQQDNSLLRGNKEAICKKVGAGGRSADILTRKSGGF